jgi:hypothetical protein
MRPNRTAAPVRRREELAHLARVDGLLRELAAELGAEERQYPALIARPVLEQAEYPQAFPHLLLAAAPPSRPNREPAALLEPGNLASPAWCLSPAVCYHTYAELAASTLATPAVLTARGRCFRHEAEVRPGVRQIEFEMREIVLTGPKGWVDEMAGHGRSRLEHLARSLGLPGTWEVAEDPFFLPAARGKAVLQRLLETKLEYQSSSPAHAGLALASVNRHGTFFGERFGIADADGRPIHTACLAVGLDRWLTCLTQLSPFGGTMPLTPDERLGRGVEAPQP